MHFSLCRSWGGVTSLMVLNYVPSAFFYAGGFEIPEQVLSFHLGGEGL